MRIALFFFVLAICTKCSSQRFNDFIPKEFHYPSDKIGAGKTFVYQDSLSNKLRFEDLRILNTNGRQFNITKSYDSISISDSIKYLNGKVVERYNYFLNVGGNPIRAEILQDTILYNARRSGIHLSQIRYSTHKLIYTMASKEEVLKDTVMTWQGNQVSCLATIGYSNVEIKAEADTSVRQSITVRLKFYYAKNIGLIQYSVQFTDQYGKDNFGLWKLRSIDDIKN